MKTFVTSDLHFGHANILKFEEQARSRFVAATPPGCRPVDVMTVLMIQEWNWIVSEEDDVYILGDVAFLNTIDAVAVLKQLNGFLHLVPGNHDRKLLEQEAFRSCFYAIHDKIHEITYNDTFVVMSHYPIAEWERCHRGAVHLYGHLHSNKIGGEFDELRTYNVGMDATGRIVVPIEEAIATARAKRVKGHHE
jgi:calcineurin-like phosphoesterase family protein